MAQGCFRFSDLTSGYGERAVLQGLEGTIEAGKLTTLIGPNGSGKSTFLRVLAGVQPYGGRLRLRDEEVRRISRRRFGSLLGFVPQNFRVAYPFTVWEVIAMGRLPRQGLFGRIGPEDEERVIGAADRVGVGDLLLRRVTALSGGEAQRVLIACVLAQDPPVLLLDEPTSALDPNQAAHIFSLLRSLTDEGKTVVAAVHDINTSISFSDSFLALRAGKVNAFGPAKALSGDVLRELYGAPFVAYRSERGDEMWRALPE